MVPGISISCKVISNRFGLQLFSINGRSKDGYMLTFFMCFVSCEIEESFKEILREFQSAVLIAPSMVAMDQIVASINCIQESFPLSDIAFDKWHWKQNQARSCAHGMQKLDESNELESFQRIFLHFSPYID